jgi:isopenicillin N synthase-like dioxygenase
VATAQTIATSQAFMMTCHKTVLPRQADRTTLPFLSEQEIQSVNEQLVSVQAAKEIQHH